MEFITILKIGGIGILIVVLDKILTSQGKNEYAAIVTLGGLATIIVMVLVMVSKLFTSVKTMFQF